MNPLHLDTLARDRIAELDRSIASWAIARSTRPSPPSSPAPLPPLPPSPRLRGPRWATTVLGAWLHRVQVLLAGSMA